MLFGCLHIYFVGLLMILSSYLKFDLENDFLMVEYMLTKSGHLVRNISMSCHMPPPPKSTTNLQAMLIEGHQSTLNGKKICLQPLAV